MITSILMIAIQTISLTAVFSNTSQIKITLKNFLIILVLSIVVGLYIGNFLVLALIPVFYLIGTLNGLKEKKLLSLFYSSYSVTFYTIVGNLFSTTIEKTIGYYSVLEFFIMVLPIGINYLLMRSIKSGFLFLKSHYIQLNHAFLVMINGVIISICIIQVGSYIWESNFGDLGNLRYIITLFFICTFLILVFYLNNRLNKFQKSQLELLRNQQLDQLSKYANQVESLYFDIRNIRHDFINIIKSLDHAIQENNIEEIRKIYDTVIKQVGGSLQSHRFDFVRLSNINVDAVKSLIATKLIEAQQKGIQVNIEVLFPLNNLYIDLLDYLRIVSIFLDNAVEATENLSGSKEVNLAIIVNESRKDHTLIIENRFNTSSNLDIEEIYIKGFSTKGSNRGLGLTIVKDLVAKYPNTTLETEVQDGLFKQQIIFSEGKLS